MNDDEKPGKPGSQWEALAQAEPALAGLEHEIRMASVQHIHPGGEMTIDRLFYGRPGGFKQRLLLLVGWHARCPELRTSSAYETAVQHLFGLLEEHEERVHRRDE